MTPDRATPVRNGLRRTLLVLTGFVGLSAVCGPGTGRPILPDRTQG